MVESLNFRPVRQYFVELPWTGWKYKLPTSPGQYLFNLPWTGRKFVKSELLVVKMTTIQRDYAAFMSVVSLPPFKFCDIYHAVFKCKLGTNVN